MTREIKSGVHYTKGITGRTVTGIFAVHGNVDDGNDRSHPGSFTKTINEQGAAIRFLWNHDFSAPPIAKVLRITEVGRDQLPEAVLAKAPDATGGVEVEREYLNTPRGDEVLEGIKAGAIGEMSYAYQAIKYDFETPADAKYDWERVRNLREVKLFEVSDVLWGMNPATQGSKARIDAQIETLAALMGMIKAGARHSAADVDLVNQIAANALALGATNVKLISTGDDSADDGKQAAINALAAKCRAELLALDFSF